MNQKTAVILMNVGTPDSPSVSDVRRYLFQFLNDRRVIDLPWLLQKILVNGIIVPFRAPRSAALYRMLWKSEGSPLMVYGLSLTARLQNEMGPAYRVFLAMRYGNPSYKAVLSEIKKGNYQNIILVPLFPQYASSTTGTAVEAVMQYVRKWNVIPGIKVVGPFYRNQSFLDAFAKRIERYSLSDYDHLIFSYHGLPLRHIEKTHPGIAHAQCRCTEEFPGHGNFCYKAGCYETSRLLASRLQLEKDRYTVSFQSRLTNNWLSPFTDKVIEQKAREGAKKILIVAPSFVADCLETTVELGIEYKKEFLAAGGLQLDFVESLNDSPEWVDVLKEIIEGK